jgi:hypothetical protein
MIHDALARRLLSANGRWKKSQIASLSIMVSLFAPTMARPLGPAPVAQSGLPNQQWPPPSIEQPVTSTPSGQPA